ncbi:MAG TPA: cyclophilin-like fold protein [Burkholderiales bacterium]|nr:cyclophilin-like fold protein [Burkholderiales bacterium]
MAKIRILAGKLQFEVALDDTPTTQTLLEALPFESVAQTWGEEVYFEAPLNANLEPEARQTVEPGTVCFWVEGSALALPWGRTPISTDARPKLVSPCNVLGRILGDAQRLSQVATGTRVKVEAA